MRTKPLTRPTPLKAAVIELGTNSVVIACPYCDGQHRHTIRRDERRRRHRRAPACGLTLNRNDRAAGYTFQVDIEWP